MTEKGAPEAGTIGGYELQHRVGEGGMGTVYLARHPLLAKRVAISLRVEGPPVTAGTRPPSSPRFQLRREISVPGADCTLRITAVAEGAVAGDAERIRLAAPSPELTVHTCPLRPPVTSTTTDLLLRVVAIDGARLTLLDDAAASDDDDQLVLRRAPTRRPGRLDPALGGPGRPSLELGGGPP